MVEERKRNMKLGDLLGTELYAQVKAKVDAANADQADTTKHIKFVDLSEGKYVNRLKLEDLQTKYDGQTQELNNANTLIEQLKTGSGGNEELQQKITAYETQVQNLQAELADTRLKSAVKTALHAANVKDVDYLTFKLNEGLNAKGEKLEIDDNGAIKNWDSKLETLKTSFPEMFNGEGGAGEGFKPLGSGGLPSGGGQKVVTKEQFAKMGYDERVKFKEENEKLYKQYTGK